jgi:hypothetical protein
VYRWALGAFCRKAELWSDWVAAKRVWQRIFERILLTALQPNHVSETFEWAIAVSGWQSFLLFVSLLDRVDIAAGFADPAIVVTRSGMVLVLTTGQAVLSKTSRRAGSINRQTRSLDLAISFFHLSRTVFDTIRRPSSEAVMHILILLLPDSTRNVVCAVGLVGGATAIRLVGGIAEPSLLIAVSSLLV